VEEALAGDDRTRISAALQRLDDLWERHLGFARKGILREYLETVAAAVLLALALRVVAVEPFRIPSSSMLPTLLVGDYILVNKLSYGPLIPFTSLRPLSLGSPERGDVIVFASPHEPSRDYVKRVVGLPGDVIEMRDRVLLVNGVPQPRYPRGEVSYEERNESTGRWWSDLCLRFQEQLARGAVAPPPGGDPADRDRAWARAALGGVRTHEILQCRRGPPGERQGPFQVVAPGHVFVLGDNRDRSADSRSEGGWQVPFGNVRGKAGWVLWSWGRGGSLFRKGEGLRLDRLFKPID
jgi:signal peptidase I